MEPDGLMLGVSFNLLEGCNPATEYSQRLFSLSTKPALYDSKPVVNNPDFSAKWGWPVITLCDSAEELISTFYEVKFKMNHVEDMTYGSNGATAWPIGAMMLAGVDKQARDNALKELSNSFGVELDTTWSYALVRRYRTIGTATHLAILQNWFAETREHQ